MGANLEEIAARLTVAQREAMADGRDPGVIPMFTTPACRCALQRLGLVMDRQYEERLTPLGLAVRATLTKDPAHEPG